MERSYSARFTILEHEADIGIESYGRDQTELFVNAAFALFSLITDLETVGPKEKRHVTVHDGDELLVIFLNELIYLWDTERFIPCGYTISVEGGMIEAEIAGEIHDPGKHPIYKEVKAATYHKFSIRQKGEQLKATVFLDI